MAALSAKQDIIVNQELNKLLECPVCFKTMVAPILLCMNGYNICKDCKERISNCPVCKGTFIGVRNRLAEELVDKLNFPCLIADAGCPENILGSQIETHGRFCPHRIYNCFMAGCLWTGREPDILNHFRENHKNVVYKKQCILFRSHDFAKNGVSRALISFYGEIFLYSNKVDIMKQTVQWVVQFIGPESRASQFRYELTSESKNKGGTFTYANITDNDHYGGNYMFQLSDGLELGIRTLRPCMGTDNRIGIHLSLFENYK